MTDLIDTAISLEQNGDFVGALKIYRDIYKNNPSCESAVAGIAQNALALDHAELAFEFFVKLLIINHKNPIGYLGRASVFFRYDQIDRALIDIERAVQYDTPPSILRIDCAALLNAYGFSRRALDILANVRDIFFDNDDYRCEWVFAALIENELSHPDLTAFLADFESRAAQDPYYQLCTLAWQLKQGNTQAINLAADFIRNNPDLSQEAAQLGLA